MTCPNASRRGCFQEGSDHRKVLYPTVDRVYDVLPPLTLTTLYEADTSIVPQLTEKETGVQRGKLGCLRPLIINVGDPSAVPIRILGASAHSRTIVRRQAA